VIQNSLLAKPFTQAAASPVPYKPFEQGFLIEAEPETYHITDHYRGTSLVLVRFATMIPDAFRQLFDMAWRQVASRRDLEAYMAQPAGAS
jgi:hypothetical protein